jgi:hypothetical protein
MNKDQLFGWGIIIVSAAFFVLFYLTLGIHISI